MPALAPGRVALLSYAPGGGAQNIGATVLTITASVVTGAIGASGSANIGATTQVVTISIVPGSVSTGIAPQNIGATTLTLTTSLIPGAVGGSGVAPMGSAVLVIAMSIIPGAVTIPGVYPPGSYLFRCPTMPGPRSRKDWFTKRIIGIPVGQSVLKIDGTWTLYPAVNQDDLAAADAYFLGGRDHIIDEVDAAALDADGFADYITEYV